MAKFAQIDGTLVTNVILADAAHVATLKGVWVEETGSTGLARSGMAYDPDTGVFQADAPYTEADHLHDLRKTMVCSRLQGRLVLGPDTCAALDAMAEDPDTLWAMRETIKNAGDWRRLSPSMDELGYLLGYSHEAMDALFKQAMAMQV
ncbi:hypothetical protein [Pseudogemmobacter sp. W21_MBD1_M6]|uniref:hypothetical protein n=1 Tax=Pseudogemmobacter sp. W21_MBD1_M6 TaxID=3240271 RepID=UPI003F9AAE59